LESYPNGLKVHNVSPYTAVPIESLATVLEGDMFIHAEELETSIMSYIRSDPVDMSKAVREHPDFIPKELTTHNFLEAIKIVTTSKFIGRSFRTDVCGDATLDTKVRGEKLFNILVEGVVRAVRHVTIY